METIKIDVVKVIDLLIKIQRSINEVLDEIKLETEKELIPYHNS